MSRGRAALALGGAALAAWVLRRLGPPPIPRHHAFERSPLLIAHRGGAGLYPENTLEGFRASHQVWQADMLELDVHASADGAAVVIHDPTVERTTNGRGAVAEMELEELRTLDAGYRFTPDDGRSFPYRGQGIRIPTLEEVVRATGDLPLVVELKTAAAQAPLQAVLDAARCEERVCVAGERRAFTSDFHEYVGPRSASRESVLRFYVLHRARLAKLWRPDAHVVNIPPTWRGGPLATRRLVRDLHDRGLAVHVWTVNDPDEMHRLLEIGVDGILTDYPDRLARVLHERVGRPLPPGLRPEE